MEKITTEQIQAAKEKIAAEFMNRYYEWRKDIVELNDHDFGWKYGWQKSERTKSLKDNLQAVVTFQKYFYPVRGSIEWERQGIERRVIWELAKEKWLSETQGQHWRSPTRYFISQQRAKEIYKEAKS